MKSVDLLTLYSFSTYYTENVYNDCFNNCLQAHFSIAKAALILGIGLNNVVSVRTDAKYVTYVTLFILTRMWANAQHDGRPAEYRWHSLFTAAKFG